MHWNIGFIGANGCRRKSIDKWRYGGTVDTKMKIENWKPGPKGGSEYNGRAGAWIWPWVGSERTDGFEIGVGQAYSGLTGYQAYRIRIFGYKQGWKMAARKNEDGTWVVGRIEGAPKPQKVRRARPRGFSLPEPASPLVAPQVAASAPAAEDDSANQFGPSVAF